MKGPTSGLSQQVGGAEGSPTLEARGRVPSGPDKAGTGQYYQMTRVRQAMTEGVMQVNQWLNPLKILKMASCVSRRAEAVASTGPVAPWPRGPVAPWPRGPVAPWPCALWADNRPDRLGPIRALHRGAIGPPLASAGAAV
jgi:hypothetical protein